jgi:hypothetical protein
MNSEVRLGDYVLASNSKVGDSAEQWACGRVSERWEVTTVKTGRKTAYIKLAGSEQQWRYCAAITPELAEDLPGMIEFNPTGRSIWQMRRELMSTGRSDPTPEEIWGKLTKEIQAGWTAAEREAHVVGPDYRLPVMQVVPISREMRSVAIDYNN